MGENEMGRYKATISQDAKDEQRKAGVHLKTIVIIGGAAGA